MKVFSKLFAGFDDGLSGRTDPEDLKRFEEAAKKDFELVPYDPEQHDDIELVWMTDGERKLTEEDRLNSEVLQQRK